MWAKHHIIDLTVAYDTVNFTGYPARAITVNHQIPAPTLRFKEEDEVTINVHNHLDKEAAIHWHGIILPWQMDGVMNITQRGIPPGATFQYRYILHQSGTYWYHSHVGLQEQEGLYGAYIIEPKSSPPFKYNKDFEVVLSDWKNTKADHIQANVKKQANTIVRNFLCNHHFYVLFRAIVTPQKMTRSNYKGGLIHRSNFK
ncbi:multicopper oxidase domain-containing protein [Legionella tunisiensis]|uniref:multicopper oxidase domain-containing protein n=1 Tax=Legionella tunisiensis TaxID=1034944 RepID=UPI0002ECDA86|nr:multicopper oxidase domain-containing protein [Legionella tunisiensis]